VAAVRADNAMTIIDATKLFSPANADEALAIGINYAEPGDIITLHTDWCRTHLDAANDCTCTPQIMVMGAKA
jgi:hypothetical protein